MDWFSKLSSEAQILILFQIITSLVSLGSLVATVAFHGRRIAKLEKKSEEHGVDIATLKERTRGVHAAAGGR